MRKANWKGFRNVLFALAMTVLLAGIAPAQDDSKAKKNDIKQAGETSRKAAEVFNKIMREPDNAIPKELLDKAEAVAIFPGVLNAAFIFGGRGGMGIVSRRTATGWSPPAFFKIGGGSFGAQIGGQKIDYIMLIMNDGGVRGLLEDKFEIGGEVSVAAGPVGRSAGATTNPTIDTGILSYSRTKGLFAGAALKGAVITPDNDRNQAVYGLDAAEIIEGNSSEISSPKNVRTVAETLTKYSARKGT